jgi:nitrite reductase/ring-hydroxylating ferredoxin subunit
VVLRREWFCAGRADQVRRPGSLVVLDVAGESVLLVRTRAGELRAHYNVCRHRGSQVGPTMPGRARAGHDRVLVALGAAHGFKFAPLLGRLLADLALHGGSEVDVGPFDPGRVAMSAAASEPSYLV